MRPLPEIESHTPAKEDPRLCTVCGGSGSTRPTGCPWAAMTEAESDGVNSGRMDFFDGRFVDFGK